jgi:hypothetical protein
VVVVEGLEYLVDGEFRVAATWLEGLCDQVEQLQARSALGRNSRNPAIPDKGPQPAWQLIERMHHCDYPPDEH